MMPQFLLSELTVQVLAQVALHFLWQGTLLGLSAACLLHVSPIRTAHARYAFYCGLLMLLAICPLVTWRGIYAGSVSIIETHGRTVNEADDGATFAVEETTAESIPMGLNAAQSIVRPLDSRPRVAGPWLARQRPLIVAAWLAGSCFMATKLLLGAIGVCTLARRTKPIPSEVAHLVEQLSRQLAFHVRPAVHVVERISQAMAVGLFRPMVLLPASWISELPRDVLEAVIAHELAHLRRWDLTVNFMQRVVETLLFFHPAVWWCSRRLRLEREMCCDELAQEVIGNRVVYAKALAYLAHQQCSSLESLLAAGIGGAKMVLLERICNVLGMVPGGHGRLYGPSCALVGAVVTSIAWIAVLGLSIPWQSRTANTGDEGAIVANAESSTPLEAAKSTPPTEAIEQGVPLDEVAQAAKPLILENKEFKSYWDLSLEEAVNRAMANAKATRVLGERYRSAACDDYAQTGEAQQTLAGEGLSHPRVNVDMSLVEFEMGMLNLLTDTENAYWELLFAWRNLETSNAALNSARQIWKKTYRLYITGTKGGEATEEAQARAQYFQFKTATQKLLKELYRADSRLRYVMGISPAEGELIHPIGKPTVDKINFDWHEITEEALAHNPELRRQKGRIKQQELQIIAAKKLLQSRLDLNDTDRRGLADEVQGQEAEWVASTQFEKFAFGLQTTMPSGLRRNYPRFAATS
ncbi:MAG TPA: M56 family metallopeptidase [Pirellulales bacterium]|nr:M56 family metallopeptidase [Pirellulales bacterium]